MLETLSDNETPSNSDMETNSYVEYAETDSNTSTTSYLEDIHDDSLSLCNLNIVNKLKDELIQPVMPKPYINLLINLEIDDSFELSLLRFIHLVFSKDGVINTNNLTKYMNLNYDLCNQLYDYFLDNPGVMIDYEYYYSDAGIRVRDSWYNFLSNRYFFIYKNSDKTCLRPDLNNLFRFFEFFFPNLSLDGNTLQDKLKNIYNQLNFNFESLEVLYSVSRVVVPNMLHNTDIQNIRINNNNIFTWEIINLINESNVIIFSDSVLRYT